MSCELGEKRGVLDMLRFILETFDKKPADVLAFGLRFGDAGQRVQELVLGIDHVQVGLEMVAKLPADFLGFAFSE